MLSFTWNILVGDNLQDTLTLNLWWNKWMEERDVNTHTDSKGLEDSLQNLIHIHHHKSLILTNQTGLFPFSSLKKIQSFFHSHFSYQQNLQFFHLGICRKSQERCNKKSRTRFGSVSGSSEWWCSRFLYLSEENWAWNSCSCCYYCQIRETNGSVA